MRKALCFVVLAFFLAVCTVSSIHAADYPSDAPLPKFKITSIKASYTNPLILVVEFESQITNYPEVQSWFVSQGFDASYLWFWFSGYPTGEPSDSIGFLNGVEIDEQTPFYNNSFGKWKTLTFQSVQGSAPFYWRDFVLPLYFCDVYVPNPSELPVGVWTDLQFTQTDSTSSLYLPLAVAIAVAVICVLYVGAKKKG